MVNGLHLYSAFTKALYSCLTFPHSYTHSSTDSGVRVRTVLRPGDLYRFECPSVGMSHVQQVFVGRRAPLEGRHLVPGRPVHRQHAKPAGHPVRSQLPTTYMGQTHSHVPVSIASFDLNRNEHFKNKRKSKHVTIHFFIPQLSTGRASTNSERELAEAHHQGGCYTVDGSG